MTAALAGLGLICGFAAAVATGSRPLGGVVLLLFALPCMVIWLRRDGRGMAARLTVCGVLAFAASHALGLIIGAWPAVIVVSAAMAAAAWRWSDSRAAGAASAGAGAGSASA